MVKQLTDKSIHPDIDPLHDSAESARAKRAEMRVGGAVSDAVDTPENKAHKKHVDSAYGNFLFSSAGSLSRPAWSDSMGGRAVIRLVSRGIFGATFFAIAGRMSRAQLQDYDPHTFQWKGSNPLEKIAKTFDVVFGKPIAEMSRGVARLGGKGKEEAAHVAWNAVNFRTKGYYHTQPGKLLNGGPANSRSLGHEMVSISFDFAMMSVGDAMIRNFVQMIDPNIKKTWMVNDQGAIAEEGEKAHFSFQKWAQSTGKAAWRVFSKNQGEDWVVALPYVYQMRAQRAFFSRAFGKELKGVKVVFDNGWNGAAWKVDNQTGKIVGDYQMAGAMDLHARFVGYNVYTLIFREGYDTVTHAFKDWKEKGYPLNLHMPEHIDPLESARKAARYVIKSTIKANMYMNPAVIPFWLMRTPQTKWRGGLINAEAGEGIGALASKISFDDRVQAVFHNQSEVSSIKGMADRMVMTHTLPGDAAKTTKIINYNSATDRIWPGGPNGQVQPEKMWFGNTQVDNPLAKLDGPFDKRQYDDYKSGISTTVSKALNPLGNFSYNTGTKATKLVDHILPKEGKLRNFFSMEEGPIRKGIRPNSSKQGLETFVRNMTDASLAYTPYFFAKTEFGLRVDDRNSDGSLGKMDKAIYKLMDNVWSLDLKQAGSSLKQMWHLGTTINRDPISREGGLSEAEKLAQKHATTPRTEVIAKGSIREKPAEHAPTEDVAKQTDEPQNGRKWAEVVAGRNLAAQYVEAPAHTRH